MREYCGPCSWRRSEDKKDSNQFTLSWQDLSYYVGSEGARHQILYSLNGYVEPGQALVIMGPSGCGKTTLLNLLADRVSTGITSGFMYANGKPRDETYRLITSYVSQNDCFMEMFTVGETIQFAADLSIPGSVSEKKKKEQIDFVVKQMGLESCLENRIGGTIFQGISGGQRRRLSIALSLITDPYIILMDEPTSGLDSSASLNVVNHLKSLITEGRTIIFSIHQPPAELFQLFDLLLLLSEGKCIYYGPADLSVAYFSQFGFTCPEYSNPADFFLMKVNTDFDSHEDIDELAEKFRKSDYYEQLMNRLARSQRCSEQSMPRSASSTHYYKSNWIKQFYLLTCRNLANSALNPGIFWVRFVLFIMMGVTIGLMFHKNREEIEDEMIVAIFFYIQSFLIFMSVAAVPSAMMQNTVFVRERSNGLIDTLPFVLANFVNCLFIHAIISAAFSSLIVQMLGLKNHFSFILNILLFLLCGESVMHILSATTPHYIIAISVGACIFGTFLLTSGFLMPSYAIPVYWKWAYYAGFLTYSFEIMVFNEFQDHYIAKYLDMEDIDVGKNMGILLGYAAGLQLTFFLLLYTFHTGKM